MPDEFGPRVEADAYRVYLYMSDFPDHGVVRTILRVGDDASVSFAKEWLHESQPKPLIAGHLFDAWRVEKFTKEHTYEVIGEGLADRACRWQSNRRKRLREVNEERAGASELRNGIGTLYPEATGGRSAGRRVVAKRGKKRTQRSTRTLTPFQQKMQDMREEAKRRVKEQPREPISETQARWRAMVERTRASNIHPGSTRNGT